MRSYIIQHFRHFMFDEDLVRPKKHRPNLWHRLFENQDLAGDYGFVLFAIVFVILATFVGVSILELLQVLS